MSVPSNAEKMRQAKLYYRLFIHSLTIQWLHCKCLQPLCDIEWINNYT